MKRFRVTYRICSTGEITDTIFEAASREKLREVFNKGEILFIVEEDEQN